MHASVLRVETERDIGPGDRELRGGGGKYEYAEGRDGREGADKKEEGFGRG